MKLTVKTPFSWAHQGVHVESYEAGQVIDTEDEDLIDVSLKEKWTVKGEPKQGKDQSQGQDQDQTQA